MEASQHAFRILWQIVVVGDASAVYTGSFDLLGCGHSYEYCAGGRCRHGLCPLGRKEERGKELCAGITSVITALGEWRPEDWELRVGKGQRHHVWSLALPAMCKAQPNVLKNTSLPGVQRCSVNRVLRSGQFGNAN